MIFLKKGGFKRQKIDANWNRIKTIFITIAVAVNAIAILIITGMTCYLQWLENACNP